MNQSVAKKPHPFARWYRGHVRAIREGFLMPLQTPWSSLFTIITLGICFYLPLMMWTVWQNFDELEAQWQSKGSMAVFLKPGINADEMTAIQLDLNERNLISKSQVVQSNEIKSQLNKDPQLNKVIAIIEDQQLPDQILITPHPEATNEQLLELSQKLQLNPSIDYVSFDADWFNQLQTLTRAFFYMMQASVVVFLIIVLVFLSHSIGNEIANHKKEIALNKLLGAFPGQIRRRFLYGGIYYGIAASIFALLLLNSTLWWISKPIQELSASFGQQINIHSLDFSTAVLFLFMATTITWLGARFSASSHIRNL
ncbi:cell division protein FtsX [Marinicella rhabdoformis]|uniref:cell division protein FtsX n=1 Tax=Marinicella rhabdoformis TaxID=2580566 RepID=UPI0012AEB217|nr:FtsX-like permease family protein [Marinicella rhabdoformis]